MVTFNDAKEVAQHLVSQVRPELVMLFGSVARENVGNDLDLLVVINDQNYHGRETDMLLQRSLGRFHRRFDIEPFVMPVSSYIQQIRSGAPFLNAALKDGRILFMNNHVKEWLRQSEEELRTAKYLADGGFSRSACYHAEQSLEKYLKAKLIDKGWDLEKTHSIRRLLAISEEYGLHYDLTEDAIAFIDSIYRGRYPAEAGLLPQGEPDADDAQHTVSIVESVVRPRSLSDLG